MGGSMMIYALAGLCFLVIAGLGLAFSGNGSQAAKRARQFSKDGTANNKKKVSKEQDLSKRSKQTQQMLANLRKQNEERKRSLLPNDTATLISQAGLDFPVSMFWAISTVLGALGVLAVFASGAGVSGITVREYLIPGPLLMAFAGVAGFFGVPRWMLGMLKARRAKKLTSQFADAVDIIVRGVKSGLPLTECLRIIAKESPAPLSTEFEALSDNISMGTTLEKALEKFYHRVPLPEVNFFVTVLSIQSKSGGNLSEALGNLSAIIRSRKMMREKVKAMSSEAKASAGIIASLPFVVTGLVYMTSPDYISDLWTTSTGRTWLGVAAGMMFTGVMVMRRMINFKI